MKSQVIKTGVSLVLTIALALCAALTFPIPASAATPAIAFDVIQQANGAVYAVSEYCDAGMKEIKDAYGFCVAGDQVYFLSDWDPAAPYAVSLFASNLDGGGKKLLAEHLNGIAWYLDGKIYYVGAANEQGKSQGVYCLDIGTGKKKRLLANASLLSIYDDAVYYRDTAKGGVYRCTLTGGKKKLFSNMDGYDYGVVSDGKYFALPDGDDSIYALDLQSPARYDRVAYADEYGLFLVDAGWVYYVRDNALYKCKTDANNGGDEIKLCAISSDAYMGYPVRVAGGTLYFIEHADRTSANTFLYKVPVSGGSKTDTGKSWVES